MFLESLHSPKLPRETSMVPLKYVAGIQKVAMGDVRKMTGNEVNDPAMGKAGYSLAGCVESDTPDMYFLDGNTADVSTNLDVSMQKPHPREYLLSVGFAIGQVQEETLKQIRDVYDFRWGKNSSFALALRTTVLDISILHDGEVVDDRSMDGVIAPLVGSIAHRVVHHPVSSRDCVAVEQRVYGLGIAYILGRNPYTT